MAYNPSSGQGAILYRTAVPNVALTTGGGAVASHNMYISRAGTLFDGGATGATLPPAGLMDDFAFNCNQYDYIKVSLQASALTGVVGCNIGLIDLWPSSPLLPQPANLATVNNMQWFWAPAATNFVASLVISPNIAQTQASGSVAITNQVAVGGRPGNCMLYFFASTLPTAGNQLYITVQGF